MITQQMNISFCNFCSVDDGRYTYCSLLNSDILCRVEWDCLIHPMCITVTHWIPFCYHSLPIKYPIKFAEEYIYLILVYLKFKFNIVYLKNWFSLNCHTWNASSCKMIKIRKSFSGAFIWQFKVLTIIAVCLDYLCVSNYEYCIQIGIYLHTFQTGSKLSSLCLNDPNVSNAPFMFKIMFLIWCLNLDLIDFRSVISGEIWKIFSLYQNMITFAPFAILQTQWHTNDITVLLYYTRFDPPGVGVTTPTFFLLLYFLSFRIIRTPDTCRISLS